MAGATWASRDGVFVVAAPRPSVEVEEFTRAGSAVPALATALRAEVIDFLANDCEPARKWHPHLNIDKSP